MKSHREDGAVLLTTLLIMTIMATLAVSLMNDARFAIRRAIAIEDIAQAELYLDGAEAYALDYASNELLQLDPEQLSLALTSAQDIVFPIEDGVITLTLRDGTNCASPEDAGGAQAERLSRLFQLRGVPQSDALSLVNRIKDWQDADQTLSPGGAEDGSYLTLQRPYRTAGSPMSAVSELRAIEGFTPDIYARVAPFMCVGTADSPVNVNTLTPADAPLLAAAMATSEAEALGLISQRPPGGWSDLALFVDEPTADDPVPDPELEPDLELDDPLEPATPTQADGAQAFVLEPQSLNVGLRVDYRGRTRFGRVRLSLQGEPTVLSRQRGEAAIALPKVSLEADTSTGGNG